MINYCLKIINNILGIKVLNILIIVVAFSSILAIDSVHAAKAIPIQIGDWYLEPTIDITYGRAEAKFTADTIQTKDSFFEINPKIILSNKTQEREIFFSYELDAVRFNDNSDGDYESSFFNGEYRQSLSNRSDLSLRGEYSESSQTNGVRSELQTISPISEDQRIDIEARELALRYEFYGSQRQRAGHLFDVSVAVGDRSFQSSESGFDVEGRDISYTSFDAKWRYLWSEGNGVFVNFETIDFDYKDRVTGIGVELDNSETEFIIGLEWRAKQNISGEIGIGIVRKKFDNIDVEVEIPSFYGELEILPTELDTFRVEAQRKPIEQAGTGAFQDYRELELSWVRRISPRWSFEAYVGGGDVEYEQSTREDEFYRYGLLLEYRLSRAADLIFGYKYFDDDSNEDRFDYNGSNIFITFSTGL